MDSTHEYSEQTSPSTGQTGVEELDKLDKPAKLDELNRLDEIDDEFDDDGDTPRRIPVPKMSEVAPPGPPSPVRSAQVSSSVALSRSVAVQEPPVLPEEEQLVLPDEEQHEEQPENQEELHVPLLQENEGNPLSQESRENEENLAAIAVAPTPLFPSLPDTPVIPVWIRAYQPRQLRQLRRQWQQRQLSVPAMIVLALLTILITVVGVWGRSFSNGKGQIAPVIPNKNVSSITLPFTKAQLADLSHLASYMQYKQLASLYVAHMSLDVELGQLIMVEYSDTNYSADLNYMVNNLHAGGVIMYEFQMLTYNQTRQEIAAMQQHATFPLIISTDEEGGPYVHRLKNIYGLRMSATDIANTGNVNVATQQGQNVAKDLLSLGINENLAPDVDVNLVNGYDMVTRTFGNDPNSVIKYAGAYMQALQNAGVIACIKHFPGLGDAVTDAHTGLPVVNRSKQQLYSVELAPFKYFIQAQNPLDTPGMIMPTDVLMPAIDPVMPAELSHTFMTDILRKQLGFDGVALTDALYMQGISAKWTMPQAAVLALNAGNDMLLGPNGAGEMIAMLNGIKQALKDGTLSKARVDEAVTRIIALKMSDHLMPAIPPQA